MEYGMDYGILTKASTGGRRSIKYQQFSAKVNCYSLQCMPTIVSLIAHESYCACGFMTGDGRALLWRITIHGMGGGGREGGREGLHMPFCE